MRAYSRIAIFVFSLLTVGLLSAGCDSAEVDPDTDDELEASEDLLNGTWQHASDNAVDYVHIDLPEVASYLQNDACYVRTAGRLERVSGDTFDIVEGDARTPSTITIQGDTLTVEIDGNRIAFERSDAIVEELPLCS